MSTRYGAGANSNAAGADSRWNLAAGVGIGAAAIVCCGGSAIIGTFGLGAVVGWVINPLLLIPIAGIGAATLAYRAARRTAPECALQPESGESRPGESAVR